MHGLKRMELAGRVKDSGNHAFHVLGPRMEGARKMKIANGLSYSYSEPNFDHSTRNVEQVRHPQRMLCIFLLNLPQTFMSS